MTLPLTQELLLIALDDETGKRAKTDNIDYGLSGAALTELVLLRRVDLDGKDLRVVDPTPTGDAVIDELMQELAEKPRKPKSFVSKYHSKMSAKVGAQLVQAGIVTDESKHFLGFIPQQRYVTATSGPEHEIRSRLDAAVLGGQQPDERTAALASLIGATDLWKVAFPGADKHQVKDRLKELAEGEWASEAVRKAIQDVQTAIITSVVVSTNAAIASS